MVPLGAPPKDQIPEKNNTPDKDKDKNSQKDAASEKEKTPEKDTTSDKDQTSEKDNPPLKSETPDKLKEAIEDQTKPAPTPKEGKDLILYAYSESPAGRANLEYFIKKGLHGSADFLFVLNGNTTVEKLIPDLPNIKIVHRENKCYDLGTMGAVLGKDRLWMGYKRFITMNASIRGPFLPSYSSGSCWSDVFFDRLNGKVKLVGTTVNCEPRPHIQSMLLATDSIGMSILLSPSLSTTIHRPDFFGTADQPTGFTPCYDTMHHAIHGELDLTELIESQGYEVDALLAAYQSHPTPANYCFENGSPKDILYDGKYYGSNVHPYELVFIKANRNIAPALLNKMTQWHLKQNGSAWDTC
ncbi:uncharacterized protein PAC_05752 [Phialocephala subalpina]|uniref:Uncharacterized protein n=1 Tax=Phialocephala subalpina TaxID=576137 RepID=A0A1L7WSW6_9HELO|nr:uncharacterized protein PAC_05752 [Phialocephala subalpina]